jgi:hypothetical protein
MCPIIARRACFGGLFPVKHAARLRCFTGLFPVEHTAGREMCFAVVFPVEHPSTHAEMSSKTE